jgi:hypothetical protein
VIYYRLRLASATTLSRGGRASSRILSSARSSAERLTSSGPASALDGARRLELQQTAAEKIGAGLRTALAG